MIRHAGRQRYQGPRRRGFEFSQVGPDDKLGTLNLLSIEPFRIPFGTGSAVNPLAIF